MSAAVPSLLVVSESRITRRVVEMTFADQQVQVQSAASGDEALQAWRARPTSVVIADVAMEAPNGYAIAHEVRAHQEGRRTAVILLAAQTDVVDEIAISRERVSSVLRKPLDSHQLMEAVREAVRLGPPAPASRPSVAAAGAAPSAPVSPSPAVPAPPPPADPGDERPAFAVQGAPPAFPAPALAGQTPPQRTNPIENAQAEADDVALLLGRDSSGLDDLPAAVAVAAPAAAAVEELPTPPLAETFHALLAVEEGGAPAAPAPGPDVDAVAARVLERWSAEPGRHARLEAAIVARVAADAAAALGPSAERLVGALAPEVVERVARELLPRVLEDVARRIVSETADRHVRDEIARMRAGRTTPS